MVSVLYIKKPHSPLKNYLFRGGLIVVSSSQLNMFDVLSLFLFRAGNFSLLGIKVTNNDDTTKLMSPLMNRSRKAVDGTPGDYPPVRRTKLGCQAVPTVYVSPIMEECNGSGSGSGGEMKVKDKNRRW